MAITLKGAVYLEVVDLRSRLIAFRGACAEPLGASACGFHLSRAFRWSLTPYTPINLSMEIVLQVMTPQSKFFKRSCQKVSL
ncbi:hypothetical protein M1K46_04365 [Fictibacillus sp. WQ 8-8]|uniref:hypothetical protein n=1 Tax=Fictibacillus sp. WQ 8-8 TaxID=2938788 RepID=UPI00210B0CAB|nr:hypothetical protein [Fictibacillus sp. WQ 8-8]MCQ6264903.1 hypothetical protein [Fictibacillus sp. WQ 8-8]